MSDPAARGASRWPTTADSAAAALQRLAAELQQSEERHRAVLRSLPVVQWAIGKDHRFTLSEGQVLAGARAGAGPDTAPFPLPLLQRGRARALRASGVWCNLLAVGALRRASLRSTVTGPQASSPGKTAR